MSWNLNLKSFFKCWSETSSLKLRLFGRCIVFAILLDVSVEAMLPDVAPRMGVVGMVRKVSLD